MGRKFFVPARTLIAVKLLIGSTEQTKGVRVVNLLVPMEQEVEEEE
jgi:hypothetical protein